MPISYDGIGNPTLIGYEGSYNGTSLTWQGRQLMSVTSYYAEGKTATYSRYLENTKYVYYNKGR